MKVLPTCRSSISLSSLTQILILLGLFYLQKLHLINLNNYFNIQVCPSVSIHLIRLSSFQFLQLYHKLSLIKVAWCVLRVKNMHLGSPSDPSWTAAAEAKPRYVHLILIPHGQSFRRQVRLLLTEATPIYVYSILKPHGQSSKSPIRLLPREAKPSYVCTY